MQANAAAMALEARPASLIYHVGRASPEGGALPCRGPSPLSVDQRSRTRGYKFALAGKRLQRCACGTCPPLARVLGHVRVHADLSASPHPGLRQRRLQKYSSGRADFDWYRERKAQPHKSDPIAPRWRSPRAPLRRYDLHHDLRGVNRLRLRPVPVRGLQQEVARLTSS